MSTGTINGKTKITPQIVKQIIKLYQSGMTMKEVARKLGIGHETVRLYLLKNGVKRETQPPHPCKGCIYSGLSLTVSGYERTCDYYIKTGKLRSLICPAGEHCTVRETSFDTKTPESTSTLQAG